MGGVGAVGVVCGGGETSAGAGAAALLEVGVGAPEREAVAVAADGGGVDLVLRRRAALLACLVGGGRGGRREAAGAVAGALRDPGQAMRFSVGVSAPASSTRPLLGVSNVGERARLVEEDVMGVEGLNRRGCVRGVALKW